MSCSNRTHPWRYSWERQMLVTILQPFPYNWPPWTCYSCVKWSGPGLPIVLYLVHFLNQPIKDDLWYWRSYSWRVLRKMYLTYQPWQEWQGAGPHGWSGCWIFLAWGSNYGAVDGLIRPTKVLGGPGWLLIAATGLGKTNYRGTGCSMTVLLNPRYGTRQVLSLWNKRHFLPVKCLVHHQHMWPVIL